jgi:hypothetical protein
LLPGPTHFQPVAPHDEAAKCHKAAPLGCLHKHGFALAEEAVAQEKWQCKLVSQICGGFVRISRSLLSRCREPLFFFGTKRR